MKIRKPIDVRLTALYTIYILLPVIACPTQCICKWKNGKRYVECIDKELKLIPNSLDSETQVLEFSGNDLQILQKETFLKLGLLDLQKIFIPRCRINKVDNHAFKGLANLVELDLSFNYLTVIPSSNFIYFPSLMRLSLNNNPITTVKTNCFQKLSYLTTLELSDCKIDVIENEAFSGLNHIEWLRLHGNKLSNIQGNSILPDTLRGIELQNNKWNCDCKLSDLHKWVKNFNMPDAVEPVCSSPNRLKNRKISSIVDVELACLPELSPTSLYLETIEGNNITLECQVKAIPEAKVSWWFQGQVLQNDSVISPGFRILYYLEEGTVDKKSELYILNIDNEDNGTYSCVAENPAGKTQANYTIRIIVKEEPVIIVVTFPQKHLLIIITAVFLIFVLVLLIITVTLLKFKSDTKSRKKSESSKDVALRNRNIPNSLGHSSYDTLQPKSNGNLIINAQTHHVLHYTVQGTNEFDEGTEIFPVSAMKNYSERNPDLINDAESVANNIQSNNSVYNKNNGHSESFENETSFTTPSVQRQVTWQDQQPMKNVSNLIPNNLNTLYQHSADVHLNPGCFLDNDGYPYDYGLPKLPCRSAPPPMHPPTYGHSGPFYQTLPHNRSKVQKLACKFAKDNEFNTNPCTNSDAFNAAHVRHTLEGYPFTRNKQIAFVGNGTLFYNDSSFVPSPPEGYKSEPVTQCCSGPIGEPCSSWVNTKGTCAVMVPVGITDPGVGRCYHVETRCVDTQTTEARLPNDNIDNSLKPNPQVSNAKSEPEVCSESPDEGYVGDAVDADT